MIPFLKARFEGLKRLVHTYVEQPMKEKLIDWSELSNYKIKNKIKRFFGMQYLKTRTSEFHKDLWGYIILPIALALFLALISAPVWADDVTINWTAPDGKEQCTAVTEVPDLAGYRIWELVATINDPAATSHVLPGKLPGDYTYVSSSLDTDGLESRLSNEATKTVTSFTVSEETAYTMARIENAFILLPIGTVPVGTACDVTQSVNGKYVVHVDNVTWTSSNEAFVVVADCS